MRRIPPASSFMVSAMNAASGMGPGAPGGAYDYVINGHMFAGFAAVAWPAQYGNTGVMTFIVSHTGKVYQKDLGPDSAKIAEAMTAYDPAGWTEAEK